MAGRALLGIIGLGCAVAAVILVLTSTVDYAVLAVALGAIVFGSAAAAGRKRAPGGIRTLTAIGVTVGCIVMVGQVGLSVAGMFGHEVPGYSYNSAHKRLTTPAGGKKAGRQPAPHAGKPTRDPSQFTFPKHAKTQTLRDGVKISTALGGDTVPKDAQPAKYAGKTVAMVYVRIQNSTSKPYTAGYPATYCRYAGSQKCYDVYSESAKLNGVEPFNEKVEPGKTTTFRLAFAVPKKQLHSFDLRITLDGAANNPYIVRG